jgi:cell wall-associated NlpC family hydrolase
MGTMRIWLKPAIVALFGGMAVCLAWAQAGPRDNDAASSIWQGANADHGRKSERTISQDEGLSVIATALDSRMRLYSEHDCSHLVHAIYERAGFPYTYASSSDLYAGVGGFQRVAWPQPGDLVVWRGHVGIVIRPSRHVFFSYLRAGPGIDDYDAQYWTSRGRPRFYRYVKDDACAGCVRSRQGN